jgi:ketosteroid isomerase-like protein
MSEQNVELHRRAAAAFTAGDLEALIACFHPNIELHTEFAEMGGLYHGHDGLRRWWRDFDDAWGGGMRIEPEAYFDLGATTLLFLVARARGSSSGAEVVMATAHAITWCDGLAIYFRGYPGRDGALADLGVCADALQAIDP